MSHQSVCVCRCSLNVFSNIYVGVFSSRASVCVQAEEYINGFYFMRVSKCVICETYSPPSCLGMVVATLLVELELEVVVVQSWRPHRPWPSISEGITAWQLQLSSLNTDSVETSGGRRIQRQQDSKQRQEKEWRGTRASRSSAAEHSLKCFFYNNVSVHLQSTGHSLGQ